MDYAVKDEMSSDTDQEMANETDDQKPIRMEAPIQMSFNKDFAVKSEMSSDSDLEMAFEVDDQKPIKMEAPIEMSGPEILPLSAYQLRQLWSFDNECAKSFMGAPVRTCTCEENNVAGAGVSQDEFEILKKLIKNIWEKSAVILEIFYVPTEPNLGHRLRIKRKMPIEVTLKSSDSFLLGWCAAMPPESSACAHLYRRSPAGPNGYMGGPVSYCNWARGKMQTMHLSRPTSRLSRYLVRLECKNLAAGTELLWNYGCDETMPTPSTWVQDCCSVVIETNRRKRIQEYTPFINKEKCVLCGHEYSINNKERRPNRKVHFAQKHADFLGSSWDGTGKYSGQPVDAFTVLAEADYLSTLLQSLKKDLKLHFIPACTLYEILVDQHGPENESLLLEEAQNLCVTLKRLGIIVLRGKELMGFHGNVTLSQLQKIDMSIWRNLKWNDKGRPPYGLYTVPHSADLVAQQSKAASLKFCLEYLS